MTMMMMTIIIMMIISWVIFKNIFKPFLTTKHNHRINWYSNSCYLHNFCILTPPIEELLNMRLQPDLHV